MSADSKKVAVLLPPPSPSPSPPPPPSPQIMEGVPIQTKDKETTTTGKTKEQEVDIIEMDEDEDEDEDDEANSNSFTGGSDVSTHKRTKSSSNVAIPMTPNRSEMSNGLARIVLRHGNNGHQQPPGSFLRDRWLSVINIVCAAFHCVMVMADLTTITTGLDVPPIGVTFMVQSHSMEWKNWYRQLFPSYTFGLPACTHLVLFSYHVLVTTCGRLQFERNMIRRKSNLHWMAVIMLFVILNIYIMVQVGVANIHLLAVTSILVFTGMLTLAVADAANSIQPVAQNNNSNDDDADSMIVITDTNGKVVNTASIAIGLLTLAAVFYVYFDTVNNIIQISVHLQREVIASGAAFLTTYLILTINAIIQQCSTRDNYIICDNVTSIITLLCTVIISALAISLQPSTA